MSTVAALPSPAARVRYYLGSMVLWTLTLGFLGFVAMIIIPAC